MSADKRAMQHPINCLHWLSCPGILRITTTQMHASIEHDYEMIRSYIE
jgi:hypothetical protein